MIFVIIGIVLFVVCIIIYLRTDTSVLIRKDLTKPILLTIFSFAGLMIALYPCAKYGIEVTKIKKDTEYFESELEIETARRGDISEALVWEVAEHNDKVSRYFNGYDLWFGTPMFQHDTAKYIVSTDGYEIASEKTEDTEPTEEETPTEEVIEPDEEVTLEEDNAVILDGKEYRLISIPRYN